MMVIRLTSEQLRKRETVAMMMAKILKNNRTALWLPDVPDEVKEWFLSQSGHDKPFKNDTQFFLELVYYYRKHIARDDDNGHTS